MSTGPSFERLGEIFEHARSLTLSERNTYIDAACADDRALRGEVEDLLREHDRASPLDANTPGQAIGVLAGQLAAGVPDSIGPYQVIEAIGEGGMGAVYVARQSEPSRQVAIKIVKPGMDSQQVLARFEAERQALALMEHPNIATVFDAGMSDAGRPYFAMELVRGQPITSFCDAGSLPVQDRLELVIKVCQAIQHAHQKGVIHRDIKPSNVLVTIVDGHPEPKVIDFGVAKAIDSSLGSRPLLTEHGQAIGTPAYMAPEQVSMGAADIDTRTDVYAIGVLLYELLIGSTPFTPEELESKGFQGMIRTLQEDDPARPSVRYSSRAAASGDIARLRSSAPEALGNLLRGDLDWIVMKCLEKDRERRYQTANALADDIQRYLRFEPIEAHPPATAYKLKKFVRRNRGRVIAAGTVLGVLLLGLIGTTGGLVWALDERSRAKAAAKAEYDAQVEATAAAERASLEAYAAEELSKFFILDVLSAADPARAPGPDLTVRQALTNASSSLDGRFEDRPDVEARIHNALGYLFQSLGSPKLSEHHHLRQWEITREFGGEASLEAASMMHSVVGSLASQGRDEEAIEMTEQQLVIIDQFSSPQADQLRSRAVGNLGALYVRTGRHAEAAPMLEETLAYKRLTFGDMHPTTLSTINNLSMVRRLLDDGERALQLAQEAYDGRVRVLGEGDPRTLTSLNLLASAHTHLGQTDKAHALVEEGYSKAADRLGPDHPATLNLGSALAKSHLTAGRLAASEAIARQITKGVSTGGTELINRDRVAALATLSSSLSRQDRIQEALEFSDLALELASASYTDGDAQLADYQRLHGQMLTSASEFELARSYLEQAWITAESGTGSRNRRTEIANAIMAWSEANTSADASDPLTGQARDWIESPESGSP